MQNLFCLLIVSSSAVWAVSSIAQQPPGSIDAAFSPGPIVSGAPWVAYPIYAMALQLDGKILLAGSFTNFNGHPVHGIARLFPDGSFDPSFAFARVDPSDASIDRIILGPGDKLLVSGGFGSIGG